MTAVILLEEDGFSHSPEKLAEANSSISDPGSGLWVRRPTRGIQASPNTFSMIQVKDSGGRPVPLINSSAPSDLTKSANMTANYILQSVTESRDEKLQLLETFGQAYGFFFGERPRVVQFSGTLVNTVDFNWRSEWWANYEEVFRGTKLVEKNARMYITYDDIVIEGYMLNSAIGQQAEANPNLVSLNFSMWVTGYYDGSDIGDANFPGYSTLRNQISDSVDGRRGVTTTQSTEARRAEILAENPELSQNPTLVDALLEGEGEGAAADSTDLDSIRSTIYDNVDEYVLRSNNHSPSAYMSRVGLKEWISGGWGDGGPPQNQTEVYAKSFEVARGNLYGNLDDVMTLVGGQMLASNGEISSGSVDPPTYGGIVVRDKMLPIGTEVPRVNGAVPSGTSGNPAI